jgi:hypothetical protein
MTHRTLTRILFSHGWFVVFAWAVWCIALAGAVYVYGQVPDAQKVEQSLKRVQQWQVHQGDLVERIFDVRLLAQAGVTQAIPALKQEFAVTKDTWLKLVIAGALVKLGDQDPVYWDFLADEARAAVENDAPSIFQLDSQGKIVANNGQLPPEFIAWAKARNLDPAAAAQDQMYELPRHFVYLAETGDPRGRRLLRRGLKSHNFMIQTLAAQGLAKLQDKDSIPLIIEACRTMPGHGNLSIASALLFFDDPRAERAAETIIPDKQVLEELRGKIRAKGADPFSY